MQNCRRCILVFCINLCLQIRLQLIIYSPSMHIQTIDIQNNGLLLDNNCSYQFDRKIDINSQENSIDWIQAFFMPNALLKNNASQSQVFEVVESENHSAEAQESNTLQAGFYRRKSIFHNFQKHLLGFLKRNIVLKRCQLKKQLNGLIAYELWKLFLQCQNNNKRFLLLVCGEKESKNYGNFKNLGLVEAEKIMKLLMRYSKQQIQSAQELLRRNILIQFQKNTQRFISTQCKVKKIGQFKEYIYNFMEELSQGPLRMRLSKNRKIKMQEQHKERLMLDLL